MDSSYPKYYDLDMDGIPVRQMAANKLHEIYRGNGKWETYANSYKVATTAKALNAEEFEALLKEFDADEAEELAECKRLGLPVRLGYGFVKADAPAPGGIRPILEAIAGAISQMESLACKPVDDAIEESIREVLRGVSGASVTAPVTVSSVVSMDAKATRIAVFGTMAIPQTGETRKAVHVSDEVTDGAVLQWKAGDTHTLCGYIRYASATIQEEPSGRTVRFDFSLDREPDAPAGQ